MKNTLKFFNILKDKTTDHWLEIEGSDGGHIAIQDGVKVKIPIMNYHAAVKFDGCVDLRQYSNGYGWNHECDDNCKCCEDYIHICDIDDMIDTLQKIKEEAIKHFGSYPV